MTGAPPPAPPPHRSPATAAQALEGGATTSSALVDAALARCRAVDVDNHVVLHLDEDGARAAARASDARRAQGQARSALDGVPLFVKDNLVVEGQPCTGGSKILQGWRPPYTASAVARLQARGAVLLGKTNLDEMGMGSSNENSAYGPVQNPYDATRIPGGSSGGSAAAVSLGLCAGALGSDTGGSVRQPAALCGVVGLKPTWGRVSRFGLVAFASSLDVVGAFSGDVAGAALLLSGLAGRCERDATTAPLPEDAERLWRDAAARTDARGLRVGVLPDDALAGASDEVRGALAKARAAALDAGASVEVVDVALLDRAIATYYVLCCAEASSNLARFDGVRYGPRVDDGHGIAALVDDTRGRLFGREVKRRLLLGAWVLSADSYDAYVARAQRVRRKIAEAFSRALSTADVLLWPVTPEPAFRLGEKAADPLTMYLADLYTVPASLAGLPALSLPAAMTPPTASAPLGLPVGVQLIGRPFDEATVLRVGAALEQRLGQKDLMPPART